MKRLLTILLLGFVLLTQFGLVVHAYHDHAEEESCNLCLANSQHDNALVSNPTTLPVTGFNTQHTFISQTATEKQAVRYYAVRAPPRFL